VRPDGKPVAHYTITLLPGPKADEKPEERRRRQMSSWDAPVQRVQDPGGAFELRRLSGGSHELVVTTAAGESATHVIAVQAGERKTGVRVQVEPGVRITGRVLEVATNKPMAGAVVSAYGTGNARADATAGPDGAFTLEGVTAGENVRLNVRTDDTRHVPELKELALKAGQTTFDAGTIKLLPGNARERWGMDFTDRGHIGASARLEDGRVVLTVPTPESPALKAGLKKGDLVLSINGQSTAELGNGALSYLLSGSPGDKVKLVVETPGGGPREVDLTLEKRPTAPPRPPAGQTAAAPAK
jgi:membrane-associated protease RseP (regulator of RpoE activity)